MKKHNLTNLALLGISAGLVAGCGDSHNGSSENPSEKTQSASKMSAEMQAFYASLSTEAQKEFMELDAQHKMMAVAMAAQSCNGQNVCAGMGGCKSANNACAGENSCKGQGGAPVKDPNKAVEIQSELQKKAGDS